MFLKSVFGIIQIKKDTQRVVFPVVVLLHIELGVCENHHHQSPLWIAGGPDLSPGVPSWVRQELFIRTRDNLDLGPEICSSGALLKKMNVKIS